MKKPDPNWETPILGVIGGMGRWQPNFFTK